MIADADLSILPHRALLIGERFLETARGSLYTHVYAAAGKPTGEVPLGGASEIDVAVAAARRTLPSWNGMPRNARRDILFRLKRAHRTASRVVAGNIWVNGFTGIPASIPFGGVGQSGVGRLGGIHGIREF